MHSYRDKNNIWFASTSIYGVGSGTTKEAAEHEALDMLKEQFWKEVSEEKQEDYDEQ